MEFIEGRELRACFEARDRFDAPEAVRIMSELLDALHVAHESGVIHRDVKPANVMLDAQRRVKLADFGVARVQDGTDRSKAGTMVGTPAFMSPEQISGARVDRRTDIFSAGIVLYQLLTGEEPFNGEGAWMVVKKIMHDEPPRPSTIATRVSPVFDQIVNRALAKKPDQRFASAREFSTALQEALAGGSAQRGSDAEIEFWRSIQNSSDPAEYEVYLKEFPAGVYAELARVKIARLRRIAAGAVAGTGEVRMLAEETALLEAELAQREAAYRKRAAEAEARHLAEEQTRAEAESRREAESKERAAAEEKARLATIEKAQQEATAEVARREAEIRLREAEFRRRKVEAIAAAAADAEASAKRVAEEKARREADARARALAQEHAQRQAEEIARRQAAIKQREADLKRLAALAPRAKLPVLQLAIGFALVAGALVGAWYWSTASDEAHLTHLTVALESATKVSQELNLARERQQELRKRVETAQLAENDARAKGDQAKLKELQEQTKRAEAEAQKQNELVKQREAEAKKAGDAAKVADAQKQSDMAKAAEKAAQEKLAQGKAAQAKAAELAAVEKAAAEKAAAEKAAAEKRMAEKATSPKPAAGLARPSLPSVGDRWTYEARAPSNPDRKYPVLVEALAVSSSSVRDTLKIGEGGDIATTHSPKPVLIDGARLGAFEFAPYLRAFQEFRVGESLTNVDIKVSNCLNGMARCSLNARVVGREQVRVKAGNFDAWKVEVEFEARPREGGILRTLTLAVWYADDVRRYVKYQLRCPICISFLDTDMELVSYMPASARAAEKPAASASAAAVGPEGVLPGKYALRISIGVGFQPECDRIGVQEDTEIGTSMPSGVSGREFSELRFWGAPGGSIAGSASGGRSLFGVGEYKFDGRSTDTGYGGKYQWRSGFTHCTGEWTLVRK